MSCPIDGAGLPGGARTWSRTRLPVQETRVRSLGGEDPLEKDMASHCSILAWRTPWTEEPGRLPSVGSQRVRTETTWHTAQRETGAGEGCWEGFSGETVVCVRDGAAEECSSEGTVGGATPDPEGARGLRGCGGLLGAVVEVHRSSLPVASGF